MTCCGFDHRHDNVVMDAYTERVRYLCPAHQKEHDCTLEVDVTCTDYNKRVPHASVKRTELRTLSNGTSILPSYNTATVCDE